MLTSATLATALAVALSSSAPSSSALGAPHFVVPLAPGEVDPLPLESVSSEVKVAGVVAEITLHQRWRNRGTRPIEAVYVFPSSTRAAVHGVTMRIDDRVLRAKIDRKAAARATYESAKARGQSASLLEQERTNVLRMSVANILPGDVIDVEVHASELLVPEEGVYSIVVPQVVGPRYVGGDATAQDAEVFANPTLPAGSPVPYRWSSSILVSSPLDIQSLASPTHAIAPRFSSRTEARIALDDTRDPESGARDLVVRFTLGAKKIDTGVLLYRDKEHGENYFLLLAEPPRTLAARTIPAREVVFIVDTSGSMQGEPLAIARRTLDALVDTLGPQDRFNVLTFASGSQLYAPSSVPPTAAHRARAGTFVNGSPSGGTELADALTRALALPRHAAHLSRSFVVITDGYVAADRSVLRAVRDHLDEANVFVFGTGSSVNRALLEQIAKAGRGEPFYALHTASATTEVARFTRLVSRPALTDVRVSFDRFDAYDLEPGKVPDLFADRPIVVFGKYRDGAGGRIIVRGHNGDGAFENVIPVEDHRETDANAALRVLWARARLEALLEREDETAARTEEATALALEHDLLSPHTSFVVVDDRLRADEAARTVRQPLPLPDGVPNGAVGSEGAMLGPGGLGTGINNALGGLRGGELGDAGGAGGLGTRGTGASSGDRVGDHGRRAVDFSDVQIEGELARPEGAYILNRRRTDPTTLIEPRTSFRAEMLESVSGLDGDATGGALGIGGLGVSGAGSGGGGYGVGMTGKGASVALGGRGKAGSASVHSEAALVHGALDTNVIGRVLRTSTAQVRFCYERALAKNPTITGKLTIALTITADGTVKSARVKESTLASPDVEACVLKVVTRTRFPRPQGGGDVEVVYPYVFAPPR